MGSGREGHALARPPSRPQTEPRGQSGAGLVLPHPLQLWPLPQTEMQLLLLVSLLLAPAPGSSVSAALPEPGRPCWGSRRKGHGAGWGRTSGA